MKKDKKGTYLGHDLHHWILQCHKNGHLQRASMTQTFGRLVLLLNKLAWKHAHCT